MDCFGSAFSHGGLGRRWCDSATPDMASIELVQPFWGREADIMDLWANTAGIILGILIARGIVFIFKIQP